MDRELNGLTYLNSGENINFSNKHFKQKQLKLFYLGL